MAPFPAAAIVQGNDPWGEQLQQSRPPISKTNPFRMGAFSGTTESSVSIHKYELISTVS